MQFGLLYELQFAKPWPKGWEQRLYQQAIEQIELADRVGFDCVWAVEHHFLTEFSHSSAPEVFLSAVSQRAPRIRIGHAVVLMPSPYNHPVRVAERIAALDIVSNGRVEFGTGRSATPTELEGFGIDPGDTKAMWSEAVDLIPRMWTEPSVTHEGRFFSLPARSVWPKPVQQPHPPMWVAAASPRTFVEAAERGLGVLCFLIGRPSNLTDRIALYREAIRGARPVAGVVNNRVAGFTITLCLDDNSEAQRIGGAAALWYSTRMVKLIEEWRGKVVPGYERYADVHWSAATQATSDITSPADNGAFCIGDPDACCRVIDQWQAAGVDQLICLMQAGRTPHEKIMRSIELFGERIIPKYRD